MSKILIIDDDIREAENARDLFSRYPANLEFTVQDPKDIDNPTDYLQLIDDLPASAVMVDHRLGERAGTSYTGLQLAISLRSERPMLPIFILTKYATPDSLERNGFDVDDIFDKANVGTQTYTGRLLRSMSRYEEALSQNSQRLRELVSESLKRELNSQETEEVIHLRVDRGLEHLGHEIELTQKTQIRVSQKKDILEALNKLLEEDN